MPDIPTKPTYTHGSTGTEPSSSIDYTNGDPLEADNLDYFVNTPFETLKDVIDFLNAIDTDGDGVVDAADTAGSADSASKYKGNDIDTDGDGKVDAADVADSADTADLYKSNDIDSDGDGVVDAADTLRTGGSAAIIRDTTNNIDLLVANEGGPVNVPVTLQEKGNDVLTTADDVGVAISDDGTEILATTTGINFKNGLDVTDDGDGTVTIDSAGSLSELTIDVDKDWQNYDIFNVRKFTAEDGMVMDKTLEANESFTIESNESMVVSESYTVEDGATLTIEDGGSLTVM